MPTILYLSSFFRPQESGSAKPFPGRRIPGVKFRPDPSTLAGMAAMLSHEPDPAPSAAVPHRAPGGAEKPKPARRTPYLAGLLFVVAFAWAAGLLDKAASLGLQFFELYAQSQLAMLEAADNVAGGRAEYAVLLDEGMSVAVLKAKLEPMVGLRYERESAFPSWIVVSVAEGDNDAVTVLKSADFARLVVPNRGLWICH